MSWTFGGTDTCLTMSCWLVGKWEFAQISSDHVELDFNWVEDFTVVNANDVADHLGHNNTVSQVSFDCWWLFTGLTVLLCLFALIVQSVVSVFDFSGKSSSLSGSEQFDDLFGGEGVDLFRGVTSEGVLLKTLLFLLDGGHNIVMVKFILIFINPLINFFYIHF